MISRVTADFENPELAELAMAKVRESVQFVYSAKMMYNRISDGPVKKSRGSAFSLIPAYYSTHSNQLTDVIGEPASNELIPHTHKRAVTTACIVCGSAAVDDIISVLNAMGGTNIRFAS